MMFIPLLLAICLVTANYYRTGLLLFKRKLGTALIHSLIHFNLMLQLILVT